MAFTSGRNGSELPENPDFLGSADRNGGPIQESALRFHLSLLFSVSCTLLLVAGSTNAADSSTANTPEMYAHHEMGLPTDLLARAAAANQDLHASLQSFVCRESIERYTGRTDSNDAKHLDTVSV